jgi:hypothetical protein
VRHEIKGDFRIAEEVFIKWAMVPVFERKIKHDPIIPTWQPVPGAAAAYPNNFWR